MDALQLNSEIYRNMSIISTDEGLMTQLLRYLRKLASKKVDETLMTKDEFFANVDEALEQAKRGQVHRMRADESLDEFLKRVS